MTNPCRLAFVEQRSVIIRDERRAFAERHAIPDQRGLGHVLQTAALFEELIEQCIQRVVHTISRTIW
jgi:hypothetical protein